MSYPREIKAIETHYRGHRFRSRLEARWAVFFERMRTPWLYEQEGFDLDGLWYLPDFLLPEWGVFVEIKPGVPDSAEFEKAIRLADASDTPVFVFAGRPYPNQFLVFPILPVSASGNRMGLHPFNVFLSCADCESGLLLASSSPVDGTLPCIALGGHACAIADHNGTSTSQTGIRPQGTPSLAAVCALLEAQGARFEGSNPTR